MVADVSGAVGGLAGVHAALRWAIERSHPGVLAVAWDMPFVPAPLLHHICAVAASTAGSAVAPESPSPHGIEPFCAYYAAGAFDSLDRFVRAGGGPAHGYLARPDVVTIPLREVRRFGDPRVLFQSVNTTADLELANRTAAAAT